MNKLTTLYQSAKDVTSNVMDRAMGKAMVVGVALAPALAFAQGTDFDPAPVTAKIVTYVGYGIVMIAAWILGKWTLKSLGIIGGK